MQFSRYISMSNESLIQAFEGVNVRIVWDEEQQEYYFSIADIVQILTESVDVKQYIKRMRSRDPELDARWGTICTPTRMRAADGKYYRTQAATMEGVLRIVQSIPSKKAEPLKQWLAEVGSQRIDQMIDPELTFQMAVEDYRQQGYSDAWINERMKSIMTRKALTDEWERVGVKEQREFAILTNILTKAWSGMTTGQYGWRRCSHGGPHAAGEQTRPQRHLSGQGGRLPAPYRRGRSESASPRQEENEKKKMTL